jgi:transcriptional regulator with XRE-family HTH domain
MEHQGTLRNHTRTLYGAGVPARDQRENADERLGLNLRLLRERKGLTQSAVAVAMSGRGHAWHQQTVDKTERGIRRARFAEAADLAAILETSLDRLTWGSAEANAAEFLYAAGSRVRRSAVAVSDAVLRLLIDLDGAERAVSSSAGSESARVAAARQDVLDTLSSTSAEAAVADGARRRQELAEAAQEDQ